MAISIIKCPSCGSLISNRAVKEQGDRLGWKPFFNRPFQCPNCGVFLKLNGTALGLGALFFAFGVYGLVAEASLNISFIVIGLIIAFGLTCRLGLGHRIVDQDDR